jgi:hypothetical protein
MQFGAVFQKQRGTVQKNTRTTHRGFKPQGMLNGLAVDAEQTCDEEYITKKLSIRTLLA